MVFWPSTGVALQVHADSVPVAVVPDLRLVPTTDLLPTGFLALSTGFTTTTRSGVEEGGTGSGNQTYFGGIGFGATDRLTALFAIGVNDDPTYAPVKGQHRDQQQVAVALGAKTRLARADRVDVGLQVSAEAMWVTSAPGLFNAGAEKDTKLVGAFTVEAPLTVGLGDHWAASVVPSVAHLPERIMGAPYFGTIFRLGGRVDGRLSNAWSLWASGEALFGPGDNTLDRDGEFRRIPLWRLGARFRGTRRVVLEASVTNASGVTPATRHLTQLSTPVTLYTVGLHYSPTVPELRPEEELPERAPVLGGITIPGASTAPYPHGRVTAAIDTEGAVGLQIAWAVGQRFQCELYTARIQGPYAPDVAEADIGNGYQIRFGPQLQVLAQDDGDPVSLAGRVTAGRDLNDQQGYLLAEVVGERRFGPDFEVALDPLVMQSGGRSLASVGVGARIPLGPMDLVPEWRASFSGEPSVWTLGVRLPLLSRLTTDVFTTNAGSTLGLGRMLADPGGARLGLSLNAGL